MAAAADAAAARAQQLRNEANKSSLKIDLFYGNETEDSINVNNFLKRFETAATSMNLVDQAEKCNLFSNYLRGPAADTWDNLKFMGIDNKNWNDVKAYFLKNFHGEIDSDAFIHSIHKLQQDKGETVNAFGHRCIKIVNEHFGDMTPPEDAKLTAYLVAAPVADKQKFTDEISEKFANKLAKTFFVNGVLPNIKQQLMNNLPRLITMRECMEEASTLEQALKMKLEGNARINSLSNMEDFELDDEDITGDEIAKINLIRGRYGRQPYKRFVPRGNGFSKPGGGNGNGANNGKAQNSGFRGNGGQPGFSNGRGGGQFRGNGRNQVQCRYCLKFGHVQQKCYARLERNAPCVDEKGVPYTSNQGQGGKVHSNEQQNENQGSDLAGVRVGAVKDSKNWK